MADINTGLILPFRFYDALEKQSRFKACGIWDADQIAHNEFLISYGCKLLPFQIRRNRSANNIVDFTMTAVNVLSEVVTNIMSYTDLDDWDIYTSGDYDYISYYGEYELINGGGCGLENCIYYLVFSDGVDTWYSEVFEVIGVGEAVPLMDINKRIWSDTKNAIRIAQAGDDRIWKP